MRRHWLRALLLAGVVVLVIAALVVPLPFFVERPGPTLELSRTVRLDTEEQSPLEGEFVLTAVLLERGTVVGLVRAWLDRYAHLRPVTEVLPAGQPPRAYFSDQREVFADTAQLAAAIGLEAAGYDVDAQEYTGDGARVRRVLEDSPAHGVLRPGDIIIAIDDEPIRTDVELIEAIRGSSGGRTFTLLRRGRRLQVSVFPRPVTPGVPQVGITVSTLHPRVDLPFSVEVDSGNLGGPSGGLMLALTVYDLATIDVDLAAGRRIAGTGEITPDGTVLPIGGIRGKVITADRARAELFLVPESQAASARAAVPADSELQVVGARTFGDAVRKLGGPEVSL